MSNPSDRPAVASGTFALGGDLPLHRLGYGAMQLTGPNVWGEPADRDEAIRVLRRAVELGVTLIDTADAYGPHVNESLIAEALHPYADELVIATKGANTRPSAEEWIPNGRPEYLRQCVEGSLERLKQERIDLYQLHRVDPTVPFAEQVGALAQLREEGKIRHVGLSEVTVEQLVEAQRHVPIVSVQNHYNLAERGHEDVLEHCEREGIAFIPWFPLATGQLAQPGSILTEAAARREVSPAQLAVAWLLHRSPVILPIPGTSKVAHLEDNVAAATISLTDDEVAQLSALS
ncbi:aldo/keto reductase [Streptomyces sp. bgisy027]|uniref:aldo/keto reductase n=1 Tax=unclassified Streptomyces TaxID=2593676 RepID=UPI003D75B0A2